MPPLRGAEELHRQGSRVIHPGPQNAVQIREWLRAADEKLRDARNESVSKGTRMDAAYDVVLCCGLTVLSARGWRHRKYKGALTPEDAELRTALEWARRIHERTSNWLAANHGRLLKG
jgi:hypothetical protein